MNVDSWLGDVLLVKLPKGPDAGKELEWLAREAKKRGSRSFVINFSEVDKLRPNLVSALIRLKAELERRKGCILVLAEVSPSLMEGFQIGGLNEKLCFAEDDRSAVRQITTAA